MKPQRRLALKSERLSELGSDDLRLVAGGTHVATDCGCLTHGYSCDNCPIPSLPVNTCACTFTLPVLICVKELTDACL